VRSAVVLFLLASLLSAQDAKLSIVVVEGNDAINNLRQPSTMRDPIVEVRDAAGAPVEGASVTFFLPSQGPGGVFANGTNTLTATTDRNGRAVARGIHPTAAGRFEIRVAASYRGQTGSAVITQTNVSGISASGSGSSHKLWIVLAIGAAAVAGGVIAATHGGSGSSSSNAPIVITPGTPTVGGPH